MESGDKFLTRILTAMKDSILTVNSYAPQALDVWTFDNMMLVNDQ